MVIYLYPFKCKCFPARSRIRLFDFTNRRQGWKVVLILMLSYNSTHIHTCMYTVGKTDTQTDRQTDTLTRSRARARWNALAYPTPNPHPQLTQSTSHPCKYHYLEGQHRHDRMGTAIDLHTAKVFAVLRNCSAHLS